MSQPFSHSVTFKLDRSHFEECFEQSAQPVHKKHYTKAAILGALGAGVFFVDAAHDDFPFL
jgi:hypothetical protein